MGLVVEHEERGAKGAFYIVVEGGRAGELTYSRAGDDKVILDHTEVGDALRGQGAGKLMLEAAVAWARREGVQVIPLCPFAKSVFDKDASLRDVLVR
jgi:uncharacterized protein